MVRGCATPQALRSPLSSRAYAPRALWCTSACKLRSPPSSRAYAPRAWWCTSAWRGCCQRSMIGRGGGVAILLDRSNLRSRKRRLERSSKRARARSDGLVWRDRPRPLAQRVHRAKIMPSRSVSRSRAGGGGVRRRPVGAASLLSCAPRPPTPLAPFVFL
jgi:hypothetical protein